MKKISYIVFITLMFFSFNIYVNACSGSDGCKNCNSGTAETECKKSDAYKAYLEQAKATCQDKCKGIQSTTEYQNCVNSCQSSGSSSSSSSGASGSYGGGGGTSSGSTSSHTTQSSTAAIKSKDNKNTKKLNCDTLFGTNTAVGKYVHDIYNIIKFLVPILLLGLSIKDFGSGILSQDENAIKKATSTFGKRLVIAIIILVLPTILNYILELLELRDEVDGTCFL